MVAVLLELNIMEAMHSRWWNDYGRSKAEDTMRLKGLEKQNLQLKTLLACAELEKGDPQGDLTEGKFSASRERWLVNHEKVQRLWREEGLHGWLSSAGNESACQQCLRWPRRK